jgi:hypothetical protein
VRAERLQLGQYAWWTPIHPVLVRLSLRLLGLVAGLDMHAKIVQLQQAQPVWGGAVGMQMGHINDHNLSGVLFDGEVC